MMHKLSITGVDIIEIQPNSFLSEVFRCLEELTLGQMSVQTLPNGIFNGLINLRFLQLHRVRLHFVGNMVFTDTRSLQRVEITYSITPSTHFNQFFANTTALPPIYSLDYKKNLLYSFVTKKMFGNLTTLQTIGLGSNSITVIEEDAFEIVGRNLTYLGLEDNLLRTLPEGIFNPILVGDETVIAGKTVVLKGNPWNCTCQLQWLKDLVHNRPLFVLASLLVCKTPGDFRDKLISKTEFCTNAQNTTATTSTRTPTTTKTTAISAPSVTAIPQLKLVTIKCVTDNDEFETVFLRSDKILSVMAEADGSARVQVKSFPEDYLLIWYENDFPRDFRVEEFMKCQGGDNTDKGPHIVRLKSKLRKYKTYVFCMAKKDTLLTSPLNCVAFRYSEASDLELTQYPWLAKEKRVPVIAAIILIYIFTVLLGMIVSNYLIRKCRKIYSTKHIVTVLHINHLDGKSAYALK